MQQATHTNGSRESNPKRNTLCLPPAAGVDAVSMHFGAARLPQPAITRLWPQSHQASRAGTWCMLYAVEQAKRQWNSQHTTGQLLAKLRFCATTASPACAATFWQCCSQPAPAAATTCVQTREATRPRPKNSWQWGPISDPCPQPAKAAHSTASVHGPMQQC